MYHISTNYNNNIILCYLGNEQKVLVNRKKFSVTYPIEVQKISFNQVSRYLLFIEKAVIAFESINYRQTNINLYIYISILCHIPKC